MKYLMRIGGNFQTRYHFADDQGRVPVGSCKPAAMNVAHWQIVELEAMPTLGMCEHCKKQIKKAHDAHRI